MNQIILIGTVKETPVIKTTVNGINYCSLITEVERSYSSGEGKKESDVFNVTAWRSMVDEVMKYAEPGGLIAVRGRLRSNNFIKDDGSITYRNEIMADKISFLRS